MDERLNSFSPRVESPHLKVSRMAARLGALFLAAVVLPGCGKVGPPPDPQEIAQELKTQGLPISKIEAYTEESDPNKLLGRPGQYVGKANFRDRRAESDGLKGIDVSEGGSIEVFESESDAQKRAAYVESIGQSGVGPFAEHDYRRGRGLLRVTGNLTRKQARWYAAAFKRVAPP